MIARFALLSLLALILNLAALPVHSQERSRPYPPQIHDARAETYKRVGDFELRMYILEPEGHVARDRRPAIVFFFGGGWRVGSPSQFEHHARYLASRGMVAMLADYRVSSRHDVKAVDAVADARSAIRWVRSNAGRLGVDPHRIVASGGSAGGHLAASVGMIDGGDEAGEDTSISARANALVLFNPEVVLAPVPGRPVAWLESYADLLGAPPQDLSPYHHIAMGAPSTIIFHGREDTDVPFWTVEVFTAAMREAGNRCELVGYEGQPHGFFNFGRGDNAAFVSTLRKTDGFLTSLGYLSGMEHVDSFMESL